SLSAIVGRERHVFITPGGQHFAPVVSAHELAALPLAQFKLVQTALPVIEVHYVPRRDGTIDEAALCAIVAAALPCRFEIRAVRAAVLPPAPSGKYFMHERTFGDSR